MENNFDNALKFIREMDEKTNGWTTDTDLSNAIVEYANRVNTVDSLIKHFKNLSDVYSGIGTIKEELDSLSEIVDFGVKAGEAIRTLKTLQKMADEEI